MLSDLLRFSLLGLGPGAVYALLAVGIVVVYRGSGVVNFGAGGFALIGAAAFLELRPHVGTGVAIAASIVIGAATATLVQVLILSRMHKASPLARVVATLGVLAAVDQGALRRYGSGSRYVESYLPQGSVRFTHDTVIGQDRLVILAITLLLTAALWALYRFTALGFATTAVAENTRAAASLGWSPGVVAAANWAIGGALAAAAGVLLAPLLGFAPGVFTLTVVPALAASVVAGFRSFPLALGAALLIGILESISTYAQTKHPGRVLGILPTFGLAGAVPLLVIMAFMLVRGRALPIRGHLADRLPRLGSGVPRPRMIVVATAVTFGSLFLGASWAASVAVSATVGIIVLSVIVVTGYAGQVSLAQYALAGIGGLFSARMADAWGLPFLVAAPLGIAGAALVGLLVALPAVRVRGVNLAVLTFGLAVVINSVVLANPDFTGGAIRGTRVDDPTLLGLNVQSVAHPQRWATLCLVLFVVAALLVANIRRGRSGRRLIAIRDNERAAASLGVNVTGSKLYAFGLGAALAGLGGVLLVFRNTSADFTQFDPQQSVTVILLAVIGSVGFVTGAVVAGTGAVGASVQELLSNFWNSQGWLPLILALLFLVAIVVHPDGVAERFSGLLRRRTTAPDVPPARIRKGSAPPERVTPMTLEVEGLGVRFGGVVALDNVSFRVQPGEVLGLIGPNGAGKTTIIDAVTGFLPDHTGKVLLGGRPVDGLSPSSRARSGMTRSFQSVELFEDLTVADNLRVATDDGARRHLLRDLLWPTEQRLTPMALAVIESVGLDAVLDLLPEGISYAQRRTAAIARAVARGPSVLLLDEPAAGLDSESRRDLEVLVRHLADDWGMAVLLIEHDVDLVMRACDRVMALQFGKEVITGLPSEVRANREVIESYLGSAEDVATEEQPDPVVVP